MRHLQTQLRNGQMVCADWHHHGQVPPFVKIHSSGDSSFCNRLHEIRQIRRRIAMPSADDRVALPDDRLRGRRNDMLRDQVQKNTTAPDALY